MDDESASALLDQAYARVDALRADLQAMDRKHGELRAELADARAMLARGIEFVEQDMALRGQHEALRQGVIGITQRWATQSNWHAAILDELRALLRPAQAASEDEDGHCERCAGPLAATAAGYDCPSCPDDASRESDYQTPGGSDVCR